MQLSYTHEYLKVNYQGYFYRCTESNITMEILDVNDNPPVFSSSVYEVTMAEDNDVGKKVIRVIASDDDATNSPVMMKNLVGYI